MHRSCRGHPCPGVATLKQDCDECAKNKGGCDHRCTNYDGSFYCSCNEGYKSNRKKCESMYEVMHMFFE